MTQLDKSTLVKLRQKVQDALLKASINYYEATRACCELFVPKQWEDDKKKAYDEFIWRCQDYEIINESDNINLDDLNYDYLRHKKINNATKLTKFKITIGTKIRSKTNPDIILSIISDDCHEDKFECSNGSVLSLKQIEKYYEPVS